MDRYDELGAALKVIHDKIKGKKVSLDLAAKAFEDCIADLGYQGNVKLYEMHDNPGVVMFEITITGIEPNGPVHTWRTVKPTK